MKKTAAVLLCLLFITIILFAGCSTLIGDPIVGSWQVGSHKFTFAADGTYTYYQTYDTIHYEQKVGTWKLRERGDEISYYLEDDTYRRDVVYYVPKTDTIYFLSRKGQFHRAQ